MAFTSSTWGGSQTRGGTAFLPAYPSNIYGRLQKELFAPAPAGPSFAQPGFEAFNPWAERAFGLLERDNATRLPGPTPIDTGPIWNEQQIGQRVNLSRALADAAMQSAVRQAQGQAVGRGFGAGSPYLAAINASLMGQNIGSRTAAENELRFNAAQENARQVLSAQSAAAQQNVGLANAQAALANAQNRNAAGILAAIAQYYGQDVQRYGYDVGARTSEQNIANQMRMALLNALRLQAAPWSRSTQQYGSRSTSGDSWNESFNW